MSAATTIVDRARLGRAPRLPSAEIVLLTANSAPQLKRSLPAVRQAGSEAGTGLVVVDFGSTDGTREYLAEHAPGARGIWLERDDGLTEAMVAAWMDSSADVLVVIRSWLEPTDGRGVVRLLEHLARDPKAAAVAPVVEGVFAIRRADLMEILRHPEYELRNESDLFLELRLQGRQVDELPGGDWRDLLTEVPAGLRRQVALGRRDRPVVLHVMECFAGGTERHLLDLIRHADGFDHVMAIPSYHHARSTEHAALLAEEAGARVERVEMGRSRAPHRHAAALLALRRLVVRVRPDIVHGHSSIGGAMARLATVGSDVPVVYTPHAASRSSWARAVERLLRPRAARLIAVSESERQYLLAERIADQEQVVVIPNGIELMPPLTEPLRSRLGISSEVPLIGCVARLAWQKAPDVFVSACGSLSERLPDAHFVLIGSGPMRAQVAAMVADAGIGQRFHLIDSMPDASTVLGQVDVYVLPSRFEGCPYTPLEAMRAGTPVVVTNAPGNRDVVQDGVSGLVVEADEPEALASAVLRVVNDPELGRRLVDGARGSLGRFEVSHMAAATEAVYAQLCRSGSARTYGQVPQEFGVRPHASLP